MGLGTTGGWRFSEEALAASLERAGARVVLVRPPRPPEVRTLMLTDLVQALLARRATCAALGRHDVSAVLYVTSTAALLAPRRGAIRFDAPAAANRPGRNGLWQRPLERRRLAAAPLLVPMDGLALAEAGNPDVPAIVVPVAVEPSGPPAATRDLAALTYAANPRKKGLDRVLAAWDAARRPGETLVVAGIEPGPASAGVEWAGRLDRPAFRALMRRARIFLTAPRREDYGIVQLEALADGCMLVTAPAPGPYAALPLARALDPRLVGDQLAGSIRTALDDPLPGYAEHAAELLRPFTPAAVDRVVAEQLLPALLGGRRP